MTAPKFSREFVKGLAVQADNTFDVSGDFALHFCVKGDQLHVELSPNMDTLEEVTIEEETVDKGGIVRHSFIRHVVSAPKGQGDSPDKDEALRKEQPAKRSKTLPK